MLYHYFYIMYFKIRDTPLPGENREENYRNMKMGRESCSGILYSEERVASVCVGGKWT